MIARHRLQTPARAVARLGMANRDLVLARLAAGQHEYCLAQARFVVLALRQVPRLPRTAVELHEEFAACPVEIPAPRQQQVARLTHLEAETLLLQPLEIRLAHLACPEDRSG